MSDETRTAARYRRLVAMVSDLGDGSDAIGVVIACALAEHPHATDAALVRIVRREWTAATAEARADRAHDAAIGGAP